MSVAEESLTLNSSVETNGTSTPQKIVSISADAIKDDQTKTTPNYKNHNRVNTGHRRQPSADYTFVRLEFFIFESYCFYNANCYCEVF